MAVARFSVPVMDDLVELDVFDDFDCDRAPDGDISSVDDVYVAAEILDARFENGVAVVLVAACHLDGLT